MEAQITYNAEGYAVGFTGDAVEIFRAATCATSLKLFLETVIKPCRGVGLKQMLDIAGSYTGKTYKGRKSGAQAVADLAAWIATAKLSVEEVRCTS